MKLMKKVSIQKSTAFLYALRGALGRGLSLEMAIEMLSKIQPKPLNKYLNQIIFLVKKKNKKIPDLLYQYDFLTKEEKIILEKANDAKFAIDKIIEMRKIDGLFLKSFFKTVSFPFIALIIAPIGVKALLVKIDPILQEMFLLLKEKGITPTYDVLGLPNIFYFLWDRKILDIVSITSAVIFIGLIVGIFALREFKPSVLYRMIPYAAYDDMPYILSYMSALNKVGYPAEKVADILARSNIRKGWKQFFLNLRKRINKGEKIYQEFERAKFPKEIVTYIKYDELGGDFWHSIDSIKELAISRNKQVSDFFVGQLKPLMTILGYAIIFFFLISVLMLNFAMTNIGNLLSTS
jgi:type II secretory pathway component PulF